MVGHDRGSASVRERRSRLRYSQQSSQRRPRSDVTMRPSPGGLRSEKGGDRNAQQRHCWRTRSILPPLSPRIFLHLAVHSATVAIVRAVHRGPPPERSGEGGSSLHGQTCPCIEHKGPPSTKNMHTKDGHDSRGRNYKAETQLPTFAWASLPI